MPISFSRDWFTLDRRSTGSSVSRMAWASGSFRVRLEATRSAIRPGSSTFCSTMASSGCSERPSSATRSTFCLTVRVRASTSTVDDGAASSNTSRRTR